MSLVFTISVILIHVAILQYKQVATTSVVNQRELQHCKVLYLRCHIVPSIPSSTIISTYTAVLQQVYLYIYCIKVRSMPCSQFLVRSLVPTKLKLVGVNVVWVLHSNVRFTILQSHSFIYFHLSIATESAQNTPQLEALRIRSWTLFFFSPHPLSQICGSKS